MKRILLLILIFPITISTSAQLPECVKEKCDSILNSELGENIYKSCVTYIGYECTQKLDTILDNPCKAETRHSYFFRYKFCFPNHEKAFINLGFYCAGYYGKMHVQSEYFYRKEQSDLPTDFKAKGLEIVDYLKIAKQASKEMAKITGDKEFKLWEGGVLALNQDKFYWVFSIREPYRDPSGFGDEAYIVHLVTVDPYTGKIISSSSRRE